MSFLDSIQWSRPIRVFVGKLFTKKQRISVFYNNSPDFGKITR